MENKWGKTKLGNVLEIKYGKDHKKLNEGNIPCYGTGGIMRMVDEYLYEDISILIPRKGSLNNIYFIEEPFWTVDTIFWTKINQEKTNPRFLFYQLSIIDFVSLNVGSAVPSLTVPVLNEIPINLPPLPEQKRIAHILGSLDDKIELNRQMNQTLEQMAQALFKSWFVDFDPVIDNALAAGNPIPEELHVKAENRKILGNNRKPLPEEIQKLFPNEFEYSEELEKWVPKGWRVRSVGKEFNLTMGQSPPGSTYNEEGIGIPFFQGRTDFGFRYPKNRIFCTQPKRFANKSDVLVSVRAPVGDINLATEDCCIGRGIAAVRHRTGSRSYTYYSMLQLRDHFNKYEAEGTVFGSINQKDFNNIIWLTCSPEMVKSFEKFAGNWDQKIEINSNDTAKLIKLRDTLLPKLISGEVRVPEFEKIIE